MTTFLYHWVPLYKLSHGVTGIAWLFGSSKMDQGTKTYGITSPISLAEPTQKDRLLTQKLIETIEPYGVFESKEEMDHRLNVLGKLNLLVKQFITKVSEERVCMITSFWV